MVWECSMIKGALFWLEIKLQNPKYDRLFYILGLVLTDMDCFLCCVFYVLYCSVTLYYSVLLFFFLCIVLFIVLVLYCVCL
jgi:hypothetical protein